ncbi:MAG TPA: secretin N-terminal domain-containing protein [Pyrinomonadaceae bacterium]|nr:secretin N-terminal domain-containing protein [Pyrinomonadaceae bacterium]
MPALFEQPARFRPAHHEPAQARPQGFRARSRGGGAWRLAARAAAFALALCLLAAPAPALGAPGAVKSRGEKNYKRGLQHEAAQQWEKAAEEFALAVAAEPSNAEFQLHYRRAIFNASQTFMQQGTALLDRGDYPGAYNAFRRAYGYDPVNELARKMMDRAFRLQLDKQGQENEVEGTPRPSPAAYTPSFGEDASRRAPRGGEASPVAPRAEQLRAIAFSGDLEDFIRLLAKQLRLNVVFDRDFPRRTVSVDLQEVTAAQALDYIFLTQGLFFQKLSNRTIVVAEQIKRPQYQQLVLRTFYLYNVDPNEARQLIQASIPPQAGRQPVITVNKSTNSITVRDTPENIRLVSQLLAGVDKERAEVVMDVQIFEVSRSDLMQFGNQIGTESTLGNLGGVQKGLSVVGGSRQVVAQALSAVPTALGAAFLVPPTALTALQRKDTTRLVASTQVHAFDGEKSTAHIGQRVPVQTAAVTPYGSVSAGGDDSSKGATQGVFGGNGYPVIQYEKTGLTLEFVPQVFPNLDVQVKMSIKSNEVIGTNGSALTPTFTERNIEGTARIQNSRTMMIASVAQNHQTRGREGLPVLGLVPILGRVFTAPRRNDHQTDIIIAVTPHVLRAPTFNARDEEMHPSGTLQTPTTGTLEAMLEDVQREEQLAAARSIPRHRVVEIPAAGPENPSEASRPAVSPRPTGVAESPRRAEARAEGDEPVRNETPSFVPAPRELMTPAPAPPRADERATFKPATLRTPEAPAPASSTQPATVEAVAADAAAHLVTPGDGRKGPFSSSGLFSAAQPATVAPQTTQAAAARAASAAPSQAAPVRAAPAAQHFPSEERMPVSEKTPGGQQEAPARSAAALRLSSESPEMRVGERRRLRVLLKTDAPLGLIAAALRLDPRAVVVRSIGRGTLFTETSATFTQTLTPDGLLLVTVTPTAGSPAVTGAGTLFYVEVEALADGAGVPVTLSATDIHLVATDGRRIALRALSDEFTIAR